MDGYDTEKELSSKHKKEQAPLKHDIVSRRWKYKETLHTSTIYDEPNNDHQQS